MSRWSRTTAVLTLVLAWGLAGCGTADPNADGSPTPASSTASPVEPDPTDEPTTTPSPSAPVPSSTASGLPGTPATDPDAAVSLTVVLDETGTGPTVTTTLTCDPLGGSHPDPAAACAEIAAAGGADAFAPLPADVVCTQEYGGAQTATVRGSVDGTSVNATFARNNGCEISRWDRLVVLLGSTGGV